MKILVTGVCGQLGYDVVSELAKRKIEYIGSDILPICEKVKNYVQMDITDSEQVNKIIKIEQPDVVIHGAAWTAVDNAADEIDKYISK